MLRRDFVALGIGALAGGGCAGARYVVPSAQAGRLLVPRAELPTEGPVFLQTADMARPIFLIRQAPDEWVALLASCTHQGCQPEAVADRLVCPCHGSEFTLAGEVLQGPADRPLLRFAVTREGEDLVVWTGESRP